MGTLRFFEEVVSFKIRRTFGFAVYKIAKNSPMQLDDYFPNRKNYVYLCFGCKTERKTFERTPHPLCCIYPH